MKGNGALSPSMLVPLQQSAPGYYGGDSSVGSQLAVVAPPATATATVTATSTPRFQLPDGWKVKKVVRSDASRVDKYYYEPGTGRKFDSLKAVERYVTGVENKRPRKKLNLNKRVRSSGPRKDRLSGGTLLTLDNGSHRRQLAVVTPTIVAATSPFNLPDGWVVEEVPRKYHGFTDKYYHEPGTGQKFRSRTSVEKHLAEMGDDVPLSQVFDLGSHVKNSASRKKVSKQKPKSSTFDSSKPPEKVNWVLADPVGRKWNPFMGESMVPESTKQQWANRFMLCINDKNCAAPKI